MATLPEASAALALSRRRQQIVRTVPRGVPAPSAFGAAGAAHRPAQPAEIAQARVFERLLRAECAELRDLAHHLAADHETDVSPGGELAQMRTRIDEVDGLLHALRARFPHPAPDSEH